MKKRILSILLIFCMVLGFVPMTVFAETNFDSTWTELTSVHGGTMLATGKYYLNSDITIDSAITITDNSTVTLDLNGHVLRMTGEDSVIRMENGKLTLQDSNSQAIHKFSEVNDLWVLDEANGTQIVKGGVITQDRAGISAPSYYGGVSLGGGTFTMERGSIVGCAASGEGGGLCASGGCFKMEGGTIMGCTAKQGSGMFLTKTYMYANGGNVEGTVLTEGEITHSYYAANVTYFGGDVDNRNAICDGIYKGTVINYGTISGGRFYGTVTNYGTVANGSFSSKPNGGYTVTFDSDGGTAVTSQYCVNTPALEPTPPTKRGNVFTGWYNGETKYDFHNAVTTDLYLKAKWTDTYVITYKPDEYAIETTEQIDKKRFYGDEPVVLKGEIFHRTGYKQIAWKASKYKDEYVETYGLDEIYRVDYMYKHEITALYPVWSANNYTIVFDANGGNGTMSALNMKYDKAEMLSKNTFTQSGYEFLGWNTKADGTGTSYTDEQSVMNLTSENNAEITLYAQWKDVEVPTGKISIGTNTWSTSLNNITFNLFFREAQEVKITASDNSGQPVTIEYLLSSRKLSQKEIETENFKQYKGAFNIKPDNEYVIYVRLSDQSGNTCYINSDGIVINETNSVILGVTNGKTYCSAKTVMVDEKYMDTISVNGEYVTPINGEFTLSPKEGKQKIVVIDKTGNKSEITVTVNKGHTPLDDDGDCTTSVLCKFCGEQAIAAKKEHTWSEWASAGNGRHNRHCTTAGCKAANAKNCSGGTATCTLQAVCEICGGQYGGIDSKNHRDLEHKDSNAATVTSRGNREYWYCKDCGKCFADKDGITEIKLDDIVISKLPPKIIEGQGASTSEGERKALVFRSNAAFCDFIRVEIDAKPLNEENYTKKEGSTIITLEADYIATLPIGEHTIDIVSKSGKATANLTITSKEPSVIPTPNKEPAVLPAPDKEPAILQTPNKEPSILSIQDKEQSVSLTPDKRQSASPTTGDDSYMILWTALVIISGSMLIGTGVYDKRKRVK